MKIRKKPLRSGDIKKSLVRDIDNTFEYFSEIMSKTNFNLDIFYKNIKGVTLKGVKKFSKDKETGLAFYDLFNNKILYLVDSFKNAIMHELFHLSSTLVTGKTLYSGFFQLDLETNESICYGLNEAYTAILDKTYFSDYTETKRDDFKDTYSISSYFVSTIEDVVGKENMEKMYSECDLYSLTKILINYTDKKSTFKFYRALDYICIKYESTRGRYASNTLMRCINYAVYYTLRILLNYVNEAYVDNDITKEEYQDILETIYNQYSRPIILHSFIKRKSKNIEKEQIEELNKKIYRRVKSNSN